MTKKNLTKSQASASSINVLGKDIIFNKKLGVIRVDKETYPLDTTLELFNVCYPLIDRCKEGTIDSFRWSNPALIEFSTNTVRLGTTFGLVSVLLRLNVVSSRSIWKMFPTIPNVCLTRLREVIASNHVIYQYKCALLECVRMRYTRRNLIKVQEVFKANGLAPENYIFYYILLSLDAGKDIRKSLPNKREVINYFSMQQEIKDICSDPYNFKLCKYHTAKKLLFVCNSSGIPIDDMASDVFSYFIVSYMGSRYFHNKDHAVNYARASAITIVQRIIYAYTHYTENVNIWSEGDKYFHRESSLNDVSDSYSSTGMTGHILLPDSSHSSVEDQVHARLDESRQREKLKEVGLGNLTLEDYEFIMSAELD